eukprot:scaffold47_cov258-Pinguiococcus_pyrenoidosus.AAC.9
MSRTRNAMAAARFATRLYRRRSSSTLSRRFCILFRLLRTASDVSLDSLRTRTSSVSSMRTPSLLFSASRILSSITSARRSSWMTSSSALQRRSSSSGFSISTTTPSRLSSRPLCVWAKFTMVTNGSSSFTASDAGERVVITMRKSGLTRSSWPRQAISRQAVDAVDVLEEVDASFSWDVDESDDTEQDMAGAMKAGCWRTAAR